ncbi:hypothetical protein HY621_03270 [Candidatus Uhrbacteria bacterium]|nr:hypothetical protein [Candidatus Uhrbacteria bacterium]
METKKVLRNILAPALLVIGLLFIVFGGKDIYHAIFSKGPKSNDKAVQEALLQSKELKEYEEPRTGARFLYPKNWSAKPIQNGTSFSTLDDAINVRASVDDFSGDKEEITPERYRDLTRTQLKDLEKEANITYTPKDEGTTTVANLPAYEWTYSLQVKDVRIGGSQVWFMKDKKVFVMTYTAPEQLFDLFYPLYQQMVSSLK